MKEQKSLTQLKDSEWFANEQSGYSGFDYKRVLARLRAHWYITIVSILLGLTAAYLINRYTTKVYTVKSSIIIKGNNERVGADFLYGNPLMAPYRNYDNELFLLKSYPLIQSVVEDLHFTSSFYKEGNVKTSEVYEYIPIEVHPVTELPYGKTVRFKLIDKQQFIISEMGEDYSKESYRINDTISFNGVGLIFRIKPANGLHRYLNEDLLLTFHNPIEMAKQYESRLNIFWASDGTSIINLEINGSSPEKEMDFLDGLIRNYQQYDLEKKNYAAIKSLEFIDQQLAVISDSLRFFEGQLEKFKNKNTSTDLSVMGIRLYEKLEGFESGKAELNVRESYYKYLSDYIRNDDTSVSQVILPSTVGITDPVLSNLVNQLLETQMTLKMFIKSKENVLYIDMQKKLEQIRQDILESINSVKDTDKIKLNHLERQIRLVEEQLEYIPTAERELVSIKRNYSLSESIYLFLMQKRAEAGITKASTVSDISVVNPPMTIGGAISPKSSRNFIIGFILGLVFPLLLFAILEYTNDKIQSREDIEQVCEIPFIGGVGHNTLEHKLAVINKPKSSVSESFRALRSNLAFFTGGKEKSVFMVTSSLSGEGKTFTTINLAAILALSGRKTIIIGADMRKPRIYDDFELSNDIGLSTYLIGAAPLEAIIQQTKVDNLSLISAGPIPPNPSELLLKPAVKKLIDDILKQFDFVVIDTPPVGLVTDAFVLSKYVDHTIFVVRQNYTPKNLLLSINDYYRTSRISNISVILNDIHRSGYGYGYGYGYSYGYSYGYGYGHEASKDYYEES